MDRHTIELEVYSRSIDVCIFKSKESMNEVVNEMGDTEFYYDAATYQDNGDITIYFALDCISTNNIAHESFHATLWYLNGLGMVLDESSEEAYAYLTGYLTSKIHDIWEGYKSKLVIES